jgi:hypothetical protein
MWVGRARGFLLAAVTEGSTNTHNENVKNSAWRVVSECTVMMFLGRAVLTSHYVRML